MKNVRFIFVILIFIFSLISCDKNDNTPSKSCEQQVVISSNEYNSAPTDDLAINSLTINENCLTVNYSSGGCSGDTWEVKLIDSEELMFSLPPQRNLILSLKNEELCKVYITKETTFNISNLQVNGNQVILNITNTDDKILYEY